MIFKRRQKMDGQAAAIEAFWSWWTTARPEVEKAIADGRWDGGVVDDINRLVSAIDAGLGWEFSAGTRSRHLLVVTSNADRSLRATAERWRRASPEPDDTFGYASARQPSPKALEAQLQFDGHMLDLTALRFAADVGDHAVDVRVWHPAFADLPEEGRLQVTFLALDWLLGEDGVEIWVGAIDATTGPAPALTATALAELVNSRAAELSGQWALLSGERRGRPLIATVQVPLKAARWPAADTHVELVVPFRDTTEAGLPAEGSLAALHELEDRIFAYADGPILVAHETSDGTRTYHLYAERPNAADVLEPIVSSWREGKVKMTVRADPAWERVRHLSV
ncbi:hypothetical protein Ais01nite_48560 [Asanoa ishikariensis]|uniref:DUF695 domain-containing protein n=1 Tax=Asanoa ishikariensis TaxID=137265 RepID=A0A1H3RUA3_9ACTN|nr:DUF695 domain-containing protein [Asanoa ishikariensis]GIF66821.1 hypothetical protein Ais01nite_48560 [Asanoa ishikariensis]SDZ29200.1 Family of unknown function [Asanoa ishikariensis]